MASQAFVDSVVKEIIQPGVNRLMELPYFTELRSGKLSTKRLQGWALQHYLHNVALLKGFALCMVKNSHDPDLFKYFLYQMNEEQYHPDLAKKFGLAIDLQEEDFANAMASFAIAFVSINVVLLKTTPPFFVLAFLDASSTAENQVADL